MQSDSKPNNILSALKLSLKYATGKEMDDLNQKIESLSNPSPLQPDYFIKQFKASTSPILVAFSGGKDSVAMVLHLLEIGIPKSRIVLHHHDVDGQGERLFDWECTDSYCRAFAKKMELPILFSYRKGGISREIYRNNEPKQDVYFQMEPDGEFHIAPSDKSAINTRLKFPAVSASLMTRWCSATVKIEVLRTAIAHNPNYLTGIYILTGERRQESANRATYEEIELHQTNAKKRSAIAWRPIIDWTEQEVWNIMEKWKIQPHPAYMLGWHRCSCQCCIFNDPNVWATINKINPEKIERISQIENDINFTLYSKKSIYEKVELGQPFDVDQYWLKQALGEFTAPIIVDTWVLPTGAFSKNSSGSV